MKKFFYSIFAFVLISSQSIVAAGYLATYSIKFQILQVMLKL